MQFCSCWPFWSIVYPEQEQNQAQKQVRPLQGFTYGFGSFQGTIPQLSICQLLGTNRLALYRNLRRLAGRISMPAEVIGP